MEKHICIDCTLIKNHPDCNAYIDYLVDNKFIHNLENLPGGLFSCDKDDYIGYVFNQLSLDNISVRDEDDNLADMAVLVNMDCTRIELLINADGSWSSDSANRIARIARNALVKYLEHLSLSKSDDNVVFHLGELLRDAFNKQNLPSGLHYVVVDTPFHGDIISNVLNNISIHRHEGKIEQVIMEALGITREQANFNHVFYPDTKCDFQGFDQEYACDKTYFDYRGRRLILFLTADEKGHRAIELAPNSSASARVKVDDIHDLKSVIDRNFFNDSPVETPKEEPAETPKEEPEAEPDEAPKGEPDISVTIKANTYIEAFTKKQAEVISRTPNGEDWLAEFKEIASPKEVVGYYFYTYGITKSLEWWKKNSDKSERTEFDEDVDEIFDSIFCPFCKQGKPVKFDSSNDMYLRRCDLHDNKVDCYAQGDAYVGTMVFPNCPLCGGKLEKK